MNNKKKKRGMNLLTNLLEKIELTVVPKNILLMLNRMLDFACYCKLSFQKQFTDNTGLTK